MTPDEVSSQFLPTFKMAKAFSKKGDPEVVKITYKARGEAFGRTLKQVLLCSEGAVEKVGVAPRGPLEREVQDWLDGKTKKGGKGKGKRK